MAYGKKCDQVAGCSAKYRHYHRPGDPRPLPSVTEILGIIAKPALTGWAFKMARESTMAAARDAYAATHPGGACLALDTQSYAAIVDRSAAKSQWNLPKTEANIGTLVHQRIESEIRRELGQDVPVVEVPEYEVVNGKKAHHPAWTSYLAYLAWRKAHEIKVVSIEQRLWSVKHGYAGTSDIVMYLDGKLTVGDFKTSKAVYVEYLLQVAAYRAAVLEMEDDVKAPLGGVILRFPKDPDDVFEAVDVPWKAQKGLMVAFDAAHTLWAWQQAAA